MSSTLKDNIDNNSSLNSLLGSFTTITPEETLNGFNDVFTEAICIDSSTNRIGINTLDPSYSIHIQDSSDSSGNLYASEIIGISGSFDKLFLHNIKTSIDDAEVGEIYEDGTGGYLKIKR